MSKNRTYSDAFLRYGFVNLPSGGEDRPQCVICHKVLTNESLKPSKLSTHLLKCHPNLQNKDQAYFQRQVVPLKNIQFGSSGIQAQKLQAAVETSYFVAYKVAKQQKCHTIAENLIMPCAYEMVSKVCGEDQAKKLSVIYLSNNTIHRRIDDMASDILSQVITEIKESSYSKFSLQFDESCDGASCAVLLGFVRYIHQDRIKEEFLFCENLLTTTKGEDVFNIINSFFTKNGLDWNSVQQIESDVSVDGAPAMMGGHHALRGLIQAVNPKISVDHCIIHRYSLRSKRLPGNLKLVFEDVLKIVNFIKSRDVNSRIFKELCKEMGEKYEVLLYLTDVRWLSRGKVIHRVIELRKAIQEFLKQKGSPFATKFTDKEWLARLCYLAEIFAELNSGNLQLQGRNTTVIDAHHTVAAFLEKLRLWIRRLEKGVIPQFATLDQFIDENSHDTGSLLQTINKEMSDHLKGLETSMHHYFPESDQKTASLQWIIHPFSVPDEAIHDDDFPAKEEWITMRANEALKIELQNQNADSFWISRLADSPTLSKRALKLLVSFSTTYLCEKGFSTVLGMKTKKRTRLNDANDARLALSTTKRRIPQLASNVQLQPSH
ncbi:Zinc finger BED-type [Trinorchestia longiramus]|nr:Zinc finger BED-type [Trinorchestia longiramus]